MQGYGRRTQKRIGHVAFAALLWLGGVAGAQETSTGPLSEDTTQEATGEAAPAQGDAATPPPGLDEIIVTAQKRAENIREVPLSVTAISGETIKDLNIEDMNDLARYTPNLKVDAGGVFNYIYIRGLGSGLNAGFEQSVGLFIDGMYYGRSHYITNAFLDLEQVEVLRGPQGTLFGKNTVAGALNITTGTPRHEWAGDFDIIVGEGETMRLTGMINVPIWEDFVAGRVAATRLEREGFIFNTHPDQQTNTVRANQHAIRAKIRFDITEDLDITLAYLENRSLLRGYGSELSVIADAHLPLFQIFDPKVEAVAGNQQNSVNEVSGGPQTSQDYTLNANYSAWDHVFTFILGYSEYLRDGTLDGDFGPSPTLYVTQVQPYDQWSAELRITSDLGGRFEYVAGLFYFESNLGNLTNISALGMTRGIGGIANTILIPGLAQAITDGIIPQDYFEEEHSHADFSQFNESFAVYGQAQYDFYDWLRLIVGARWSQDKKEIDFSHRLFGPGGVPGVAPAFIFLLQADEFDRVESRAEYDFSPKASALFRMTDDINLYFTAAKGFKAGGYNAQTFRSGEIEFQPEESTTYEVGLKGDFFGGNARMNFGLFRTQFSDLQVSIFNGLEFIVSNADATVQGVEADGMWALPYGFLLVGSIAYLDGTYDDFRDGPCQASTVGTVVGIVSSGQFCDLTGERLAFAPKWKWDLSLNWLYQLGNLPFNLYAGYDLLWHGEAFRAADLDPLDHYEGYFMHHARFGLRDLNENWSFVVFVRNVTDKVAVLTSNDVPIYAGSHWVRVDQPRNISAQFRVSF